MNFQLSLEKINKFGQRKRDQIKRRGDQNLRTILTVALRVPKCFILQRICQYDFLKKFQKIIWKYYQVATVVPFSS